MDNDIVKNELTLFYNNLDYKIGDKAYVFVSTNIDSKPNSSGFINDPTVIDLNCSFTIKQITIKEIHSDIVFECNHELTDIGCITNKIHKNKILSKKVKYVDEFNNEYESTELFKDSDGLVEKIIQIDKVD